MPLPAPGPTTGVYNSIFIAILAEDAAAHSVVLAGLQGDPAFGDEMSDQREGIDVYCREAHVGQLPGKETALSLSFSALDCVESRRLIDFSFARGAEFGPGGTTPMVSTCPLGRPAVKLTIQTNPPGGGTPKSVSYARCYPKASLKSASSGATWDIGYDCYGRVEA